MASTHHAISHILDHHQVKLLQEGLPEERDKARGNSVGMMRAGDWLNAAPMRALGLHLRPKEFTAAVKYRLGIPVFPSAKPFIACGEESDQYGDRQGAVSRPARVSGQACAQLRTCTYMAGLMDGRDAALDVTVVSSLQKELKKRAAAEVGSAAVRRHSDKMTKYFSECDREGIQF